jgi:hypothetical protein
MVEEIADRPVMIEPHLNVIPVPDEGVDRRPGAKDKWVRLSLQGQDKGQAGLGDRQGFPGVGKGGMDGHMQSQYPAPHGAGRDGMGSGGHGVREKSHGHLLGKQAL